MGGGIAMNFANVGIPVTVIEVAREALDRGLGVVRKNYEATAAKGRLTKDDVEKRMGLIQGTTDFNALADADLVVEAVFEERSEEHTSELQSMTNLVCRLLLEKKK